MDKAEIYDRLYAMAGKVLDKHQPCATCGKCEYFGGRTRGCCEGCPFLSPQGCTIQSLGCKLWLCHDERFELRGRGAPKWWLHPRVRHQLARLQRIADKHDLNFARATKEEVLAESGKARYPFGNGRKWFLYYKFNRR